ncbi:hypothetical protein F8388_011336 [Cannabis sativa]|uniref:Expansin-like CBD domain-containing protein n=1 Tax=Cannabis sativa TaxID=3483 RepID=A0A7J6EXV5_CANSA|nr:hypothetical protein F8388_011336 [Cannabis sativa]
MLLLQLQEPPILAVQMAMGVEQELSLLVEEPYLLVFSAVRCKNPQLCNYDGVNIVVSDYGEGDRTDFIMSPRAFSKLAIPNNYPYYLALTLLYVTGQNDIARVELWHKDTKKWKAMRRAFGAVWDMANPPSGPITLRFQATTNLGYTYWIHSTNAIPKLWKAGAAYHANVKLIITN